MTACQKEYGRCWQDTANHRREGNSRNEGFKRGGKWRVVGSGDKSSGWLPLTCACLATHSRGEKRNITPLPLLYSSSVSFPSDNPRSHHRLSTVVAHTHLSLIKIWSECEYADPNMCDCFTILLCISSHEHPFLPPSFFLSALCVTAVFVPPHCSHL